MIPSKTGLGCKYPLSMSHGRYLSHSVQKVRTTVQYALYLYITCGAPRSASERSECHDGMYHSRAIRYAAFVPGLDNWFESIGWHVLSRKEDHSTVSSSAQFTELSLCDRCCALRLEQVRQTWEKPRSRQDENRQPTQVFYTIDTVISGHRPIMTGNILI